MTLFTQAVDTDVQSSRQDRERLNGKLRNSTRKNPDPGWTMQQHFDKRRKVILFNKPFGVLPQFTDRGTVSPRPTLSDFIDMPAVYPAGRLDRDSEGLMVLTGDGPLQARIADPRHKLPKTYLIQVEGIPDDAALERLRKGVVLNDGLTRPAEARLIAPPALWPRDPPVRFRKSVPDRWLEMKIHEGRNRQVRRMTAAIGHPTLRLVRWSVGPWMVGRLQPGEWQSAEIPEDLLLRPRL